MARKYTVNWSDEAFPEIEVCDPDDEYDDGQTLREAKQEIIDHFTHDIKHARAQIAAARAVRARDFDEQDDDERCATEGCTNRLDDGEGWDGYCGSCADRIAVANGEV